MATLNRKRLDQRGMARFEVHGLDPDRDLIRSLARQTAEMADRMKGVGAPCELLSVEGAGHGIRWWEASPYANGYKQQMIRWLRTVLHA